MWWTSRLFWVPLVCIFYFSYGLISYKNNTTTGMFWFWILYAFGGIIQLWAFVSKVSINIVFDSFLYDLCMMLSLCGGLIISRGIMPSFIQFVGVVLCLIGLVLLR
jgi:hypothetical protein